jgi:hypothetical protein
MRMPVEEIDSMFRRLAIPAEKVLRVEEVLVVMSATLVAAISVWGGATIYRTLYRPF